MSKTTESREGADRKRTVVMRKQGNSKGRHSAYGLIVPSWLVREITQSDDIEEIEKTVRQYEFMPEKTEEGILYRPTKIERLSGW